MKIDPQKFKFYREKKHFTQQQLAGKLNISQCTVALWETGKRNPSNVTINRLSSLLNIPIANFTKKEIENSLSLEECYPDSSSSYSETEELLIRKFRKLNEDGKLFLLEITPERYYTLKDQVVKLAQELSYAKAQEKGRKSS